MSLWGWRRRREAEKAEKWMACPSVDITAENDRSWHWVWSFGIEASKPWMFLQKHTSAFLSYPTCLIWLIRNHECWKQDCFGLWRLRHLAFYWIHRKEAGLTLWWRKGSNDCDDMEEISVGIHLAFEQHGYILSHPIPLLTSLLTRHKKPNMKTSAKSL